MGVALVMRKRGLSPREMVQRAGRGAGAGARVGAVLSTGHGPVGLRCRGVSRSLHRGHSALRGAAKARAAGGTTTNAPSMGSPGGAQAHFALQTRRCPLNHPPPPTPSGPTHPLWTHPPPLDPPTPPLPPLSHSHANTRTHVTDTHTYTRAHDHHPALRRLPARTVPPQHAPQSPL